MTNEYYTHSGWPVLRSKGDSVTARIEFQEIEDGFDKCPTLNLNGDEMLFVNTGETGLTTAAAAAARTLLDAVVDTDIQAYDAELDAIGNASIPSIFAVVFMYNGTSAADYKVVDFSGVGTGTTAVYMQREIKELVDDEYDVRITQLKAPTGTKAYFFQSTAPLGWTIQSINDDRAIFVHATTGGTTFGSAFLDTNWVSGTTSNDHTHSISDTVTTSSATAFDTTVGGTAVSITTSTHSHQMTISATSDGQSADHTHSVPSINGIFTIMASRS